ncbi:hypothetical protein DMUE_4855 [Dictyocoela muelleri]|nr:hypothetical protein DMUE_4855 [Dictyocoela muelleri]
MKSYKLKQIYTTPYNPTGNSISERINQIITKILRIYKGWSLDQIKIIIENRINKIVNTSFGKSPAEILRLNKQNKNFILNKNNYEQKNHKNKNRNRNNYEYKPKDLILIITLQKTKTDSPFIGAFIIENISNDKQVISYTDQKGKKNNSNTKNVKPYLVGEMSCSGIIHDIPFEKTLIY